jgi:hypothetical protein
MPPVTAADPSPTPPVPAPAPAPILIPVPIPAPIPASMVDRLHLRMCTFVVEGLCVNFIENTVSGAWNTGRCLDRANCPCKGRCPGNAKHRCQEGSPIHSNLPTLHKLNIALACRMSRPAHGEDRGFASRRSGLRILSAQEGTLLRRSTRCQPRTIPITRKVTAVAKIGASNQRAWPTLLSICLSEFRETNSRAQRAVPVGKTNALADQT